MVKPKLKWRESYGLIFDASLKNDFSIEYLTYSIEHQVYYIEHQIYISRITKNSIFENSKTDGNRWFRPSLNLSKMKYLLPLLLLISFQCFAAEINKDSLYLVENYTKTEVQIPMRDGMKLFAVVYSPKDQSVKYPILYNRTPYSVAPYGDEMGFSFRRGLFPQLLREGYIFVYQDVRGRFMSEGDFQHMTPHIVNKTNNSQVDESSDAYDTIEWLIHNLKNNNGKVGMWGISYPGYYTSCAAIDAHPSLLI